MATTSTTPLKIKVIVLGCANVGKTSLLKR
jgi:GTPase SAR1 family protein